MEASGYVPSGTNSECLAESFGCPFCPRSFKSQRGLSQHSRCCGRDKKDKVLNLNTNYANFQGNSARNSCLHFPRDLAVNSNDLAVTRSSATGSNDALATRTQNSSKVRPESTFKQQSLPRFHPTPISESKSGELVATSHTSLLLDNGPKRMQNNPVEIPEQ
eukprot:gene1451-1597_t